MTHRDVRVSLYGVVAGVLIGAGALVSAQHGSFLGSTVAIIHPDVLLHGGAPVRADYTQRNVVRRGVPLRDDTKANSYSTIKDPAAQSSSASSVDASPDACKAVRKAVAKIEIVYNKYVPDTLKNTEIRQKMDAALAEAASAECPKEAAPATSATSSSANAATVDNDCEKFPTHTARYTQCVIAEKNGKTYP